MLIGQFFFFSQAVELLDEPNIYFEIWLGFVRSVDWYNTRVNTGFSPNEPSIWVPHVNYILFSSVLMIDLLEIDIPNTGQWKLNLAKKELSIPQYKLMMVPIRGGTFSASSRSYLLFTRLRIPHMYKLIPRIEIFFFFSYPVWTRSIASQSSIPVKMVRPNLASIPNGLPNSILDTKLLQLYTSAAVDQ